MTEVRLDEPLGDRWLRAALSIGEEGWVPAEPVADLLVPQMQASRGALGSFLVASVNPFQGGQEPRWRVHAASADGVDMLRCDYVAGDRSFTLYEGINFVIVRVGPVRALSEGLDREDVTALIDAVVKRDSSDHSWSFDVPSDLGTEPVHLSTRGAPPIARIQTRNDRADVVIAAGHAYFVFYKKVAQLEDFRPDDSWLSAPARRAVQAQAAP